MKLLPFLFLLSFACSGQVYNINDRGDTVGIDYGVNAVDYVRKGTSSVFIGGGAGAWAMDDNTTGTFSSQLGYPESLEEKLLRYADECYNDSMLVTVPDDCGIVGCLAYHESKSVYVRKEPTFEGFVEWLRKK